MLTRTSRPCTRAPGTRARARSPQVGTGTVTRGGRHRPHPDGPHRLLLRPPTSVSRQVVLRGVGGKRVSVLILGVATAVVGGRLPGEGDAGVVVGVYGLAEVYGVLQLLLQHLLAGVPGQLQQEEAGVGLREEVVGGVVLVQDLWAERPGDQGEEQTELAPARHCLLLTKTITFLPNSSRKTV